MHGVGHNLTRVVAYSLHMPVIIHLWESIRLFLSKEMICTGGRDFLVITVESNLQECWGECAQGDVRGLA